MTQFATTILFVLGALYGGSATGYSNISDINAQSPTSEAITLEQYVREYFKDTPVLAEIAKCESRFRHLGKNGKVLRGELTADDLGVMQINEFYHEDTAKILGIDLHTLDGNLAYAKWLYKKEGVIPWYSSSKCWQKPDTFAKADARTATN